MDLPSLLPHQFTNYLWTMILSNQTGSEREKIIIDLEAPLGDETPEDGAWSDEDMGGDFLKAMGGTSLGASKASDPTIGRKAAEESEGSEEPDPDKVESPQR